MAEQSLGTCLQEAVTAIRKNMPKGSDLEEWFDMHPGFDADNREINYWVGYIQGVADGLDMTMREVLNEHSVNYSNDGES